MEDRMEYFLFGEISFRFREGEVGNAVGDFGQIVNLLYRFGDLISSGCF